MGLFTKEVCCVCGGKAGLLTRTKLGDKTFICLDCNGKCSSNLNSSDYSRMNKDSVKEHIKYVEGLASKYNSFSATYTISTGILGMTKVIEFDETHGLFASCADTKNHETFNISDVMGHELVLDTLYLSDSEKANHHVIMPPYAGMPICPNDKKISGMNVILRLKNHPWASEVKLNVMNALVVTDGDIEAGYRAAADIFNFFDNNTSRQATTTVVNTPLSSADEIKKYKDLLDSGIISQEEFDAKKKQLLGL